MPVGFFHTVQQSPHFDRFTFGVSRMPLWARGILSIVMVPGIVLVGLSLLLVVVSIVALLLITVPVYLLLKWITGVKATPAGYVSRRSKRVEAKVTDA
jgi:putative flippase GtrA